ncbi:hypothetical protein HanXRQr2_Chr06g0252611 [Helianthus annuus]|uniref:Uncharacterized protein n=1 Tax=Helianthus annuus TaxID=4232 RepID=A0A9K3NIU5_HELAN|nr:hypothetical protein HanXRQr2_Chr06g0252611 [Helianthus annuus]
MALSSQRRRLVYVSHFPKVLVVFWRRIEVHVVWYFGNNYISSITFATSRSSSPRNFDRG